MCHRQAENPVAEGGTNLLAMHTTKRLLVFVALLLISCSKMVDQSQLPGTYSAGTLATLELRADGTYRNTYQAANGQKVIEESAWRLEIIENTPTLVLQNFRCTLPGAKAIGSGFYLAKITSSRSAIRLWVDEDQGVFFERKI